MSKAPQETKPAASAPRKIETLARCHAAAAIQALAGVLVDTTATPAMRISAAGALLQWGYGKPGIQAKVKAGDGKPGEGGEQIVRLIWGETENSD
ncbi:MAG: hypothetical protein IPK59_12015 [Rhodospirillaceae bacterium]|nr:hypothetical protein [Rhodospirillaceae bacterium]